MTWVCVGVMWKRDATCERRRATRFVIIVKLRFSEITDERLKPVTRDIFDFCLSDERREIPNVRLIL